MILLDLFLVFLQIGAFSFGGGYAALPLIQAQVVDKFGWITLQEFADLITISQMTPGPIAINAATFVGNQVAGIPGSIVATLGNVLPSCIIVTILAWLYNKYKNLSILQGVLEVLRPAVVAMIATAGIIILVPTIFTSGTILFAWNNIEVRSISYFIFAIILLRKFKKDPVLVMICCGVLEVVYQVALQFMR